MSAQSTEDQVSGTSTSGSISGEHPIPQQQEQNRPELMNWPAPVERASSTHSASQAALTRHSSSTLGHDRSSEGEDEGEAAGTLAEWIGPGAVSETRYAHSHELATSLDGFRARHQLCDVRLVAAGGGQSFAAHRVVLCCGSPYFNAMFMGQLREASQDVVELPGVSANCLQSLLAYLYSGEITIGNNNVQFLLPAARQLQILPVVDMCCSYLSGQLDSHNCLGVLRFAHTYDCALLRTQAEACACENYASLMSHCRRDFMELPWQLYRDLLANNEVNAVSEESLLVDIFLWLRADAETRQAYLCELLAKVRLALLPPACLVQLGMEPEVRQCERCRDLVDQAKNFLLLPETRTRTAVATAAAAAAASAATAAAAGSVSALQTSSTGTGVVAGAAAVAGAGVVVLSTEPRQPRHNAVLYSVGGWCAGEALAEAERYDWPKDEWSSICSMSKKRCGVGLAAVGRYLYAMGGHDGTHYLNSIERYNPKDDTWQACVVSPSCEVRTSVGIGVIDSCIYAVGGQDGVSCLNIAERYDTETGQWTRLAPMREKRLGVAVVVLNNLLYAIGGGNGGVLPLCSAERYDPVENVWQSIAPMLTRRKHHGAAAFNNRIYVAGGRDEHSELKTVEVYTPINNMWSQVVPMRSYRSGVGLAVVGARLFAVGGFNGTLYLRTVELYEPDADRWTDAGEMINRRLGGGVAVINAAYASLPPSPRFQPMPGLS